MQLPIFNERFDFAEQVCIIDAVHFLDSYQTFVSVEKQLETSTVFIINKTDLVAPEQKSQIKEVVYKHHPSPRFFETTYANIPLEHIGSLPIAAIPKQPEEHGSIQTLSASELENYINSILTDPDLESTPPDELASITFYWNGDSLDEVDDMANMLPPGILRAKGFLKTSNTRYLFSYVQGNWTIETPLTKLKDTEIDNVVVFIGTPEAIKSLSGHLKNTSWAPREFIQPFNFINDI